MLRKNIVIFLSLALTHLNAQITTNGLVLNLDASDPSSYSGSGSTWNDTSGNNKDFNINTATYNNDGYFVFGIDRDRKFDVTITKILNGKKEKIIKKVLKRKYNIQRIDGLEESKVTPPESVYKRIKEENNRIGKARAINSDLIFFKNQFIMPVKGIVTGVY